MLDLMEKGRGRLERIQEGEGLDPGFWGRVAYFRDESIGPYQEDVELYDLIRYGSRGGMNVFERQASIPEVVKHQAFGGDTVHLLQHFFSGETSETLVPTHLARLAQDLDPVRLVTEFPSFILRRIGLSLN